MLYLQTAYYHRLLDKETLGGSTFGRRTFGLWTFISRTFVLRTFGPRTFVLRTFGPRTFGLSVVKEMLYRRHLRVEFDTLRLLTERTFPREN